MGRSDDMEAEVLLLSNEMQNPNLRDAATAISTRIPSVPDLNMHPLDLNMLPPTYRGGIGGGSGRQRSYGNP